MVSGNHRPPVRDRQKKVSQPAKAVGLAMIRDDPAEGGYIYCSCEGFYLSHPRKKVREERAQAHLDKKHNGMGVWL